MRVEVYTEVQATKPHPAGGEMNDPESSSSWILQDAITSHDSIIIGSFLNGLAEELDPLKQVPNSHNKIITIHSTWKVVVIGSSRGGNSGEVTAEITSKRAKVIASMLRGTAKAITGHNASIGVLRGTDDHFSE